MTEAEIVALLRQHIKCDATGLSPSVARVFLVGFEDAARAIVEAHAGLIKLKNEALHGAIVALEAGNEFDEYLDPIRAALKTGEPSHD